MNKKQILLSVVIPAFNIDSYIGECIQSIVPQMENNVELIIIDDGSTDKTGDICDDIEINNKNISVYHQQNKGVSAARNVGLELSHGKYILFVDGDDLLAPNAIKSNFAKISENTPDIIAGSYVKFSGNTPTHSTQQTSQKFIKEVESANGSKALELLLKNSLFLPSMWANIFKRDLFITNSIYFNVNLSNNEDLDCAMRLYLKAKSIALLGESHYYYRKSRDGSATSVFKAARILDSLNFIRSLVGYINDFAGYSNLNKWLMDYMAYQYLIVLGSINLCPKTDRKQLLDEAKLWVGLLEYAIRRRTLIGYITYRMFGLKFLAMLSAAYIRRKT